jgi:hypothetical protein
MSPAVTSQSATHSDCKNGTDNAPSRLRTALVDPDRIRSQNFGAPMALATADP